MAIGQGMIRCQVAIHLQTHKGIRTLLAKRFEIVEVDEFRCATYAQTVLKDIATEGEDCLIPDFAAPPADPNLEKRGSWTGT